MNKLTIIRIIDTREKEEIGDGKFRGIPGTGIERHCDHCDSKHEIHVHTSQGVYGLGCAKKIANAELKLFIATEDLRNLKSPIVYTIEKGMRDRYGRIEWTILSDSRAVIAEKDKYSALRYYARYLKEIRDEWLNYVKNLKRLETQIVKLGGVS